MKHPVHIGTSGWQYKHWQPAFYPGNLRPEHWLPCYAEAFGTVEVNNTFYHQPGGETLRRWKGQAPRGFFFAVKANRYLTHMKKLKDPQAPLARFLESVRPLGGSLGPILYQLPPNWQQNLARLEDFLEALPDAHTHVLEFRDRSWLSEETYGLLERYDCCLAVHDMLPRHPRRATGPAVYLRLHGAGERYGGRYPKRRLDSWAAWINEMRKQRPVFVYFNNDQGAHAVHDAQRLQEMVDGG